MAFEPITIQGVPKETVQAIKIQIDSKKALLEQMSNDQVSHHLQTICNQILRPDGYFNATIKLERDKKNRLTLMIKKNQQTTISSISIHAPLIHVSNDLQQFRGKPFTFKNYEHMKELLITEYQNSGYLNATTTNSTVNIDTKTNFASIKLIAKPGTLFRFGKIIVEDLPYATSLIKRFANFKPNEAINLEKINLFRSHLSQSSLFESVSVRTDMSANPVDIIVSGVPIRNHSYSFGIGASRQNGINISASNTYNHLTPFADQLRSTLSVSLKKTTQRNMPIEFDTIYLYPGLKPLTDYFGAQVNIKIKQETTDAISDSLLTKAFYNRKDEFNSYAGSLNFLYERQTPSAGKTFTTQLVYPEIETHHLMTYSALPFERFRIRDHLIAGIQAAEQESTHLFLHARVGFRGRIDIAKNLTLYQDALVGFVLTDDFMKLPTSMRFYAGGPYSIRGFHYKSLGPSKTSTLLSHELFYKLGESYGVSVFSDMGWITHERKRFLPVSVGVSFNVYLPMGIFQISAGMPVSSSNDQHVLFQVRLIPGLESLK